jgi:pimeloyl-ACP methyl ester carboxylesterase
LFGPSSGLVGIVSECADENSRSDRTEAGPPAVIILNTGLIHRVGDGRLSTILARRLAMAGHCVLRFDLSGVGDSERRQDCLPLADAAIADVREAVEWLQSARGIGRIVLFGICSGADLSLFYTGIDSRISGIIMVDPSTPPTRRHYLYKCFNRKVWMRKLEALAKMVKAQRVQGGPLTDVWKHDSISLSDSRARYSLAGAYRAAFDQRAKLLAIFTRGAAWYSYRRQLFDAFPEIDFADNLQLEHFERCDHTVTHESNRARLFQVVESWFARTEFKAPATASDLQRPLPVTPAEHSSDLISVEF